MWYLLSRISGEKSRVPLGTAGLYAMVRLNWCGKDREKVEVEVEVDVQRVVGGSECYWFLVFGFWFLVFGFWFIRSREIP
jgi:hypothetical protein